MYDCSIHLPYFALLNFPQLICSDAKEIPSGFGGKTFIIVPVSLLVQWEDEIKSKAPHLTVFLYHGRNLEDFQKEFRGQLEEELCKFDVVLTTTGRGNFSDDAKSEMAPACSRGMPIPQKRHHRDCSSSFGHFGNPCMDALGDSAHQ